MHVNAKPFPFSQKNSPGAMEESMKGIEFIMPEA